MNGIGQPLVDPSGAPGFWRGFVPLVVLVALNLIPLAGVLWLGWDLFSILILYWLESGVVGVVNIFKIGRAAGALLYTTPTTISGATNVAGLSRGCMAGFFTLHYGIFWAVHGVFVLLLPLFAGIGQAVRAGTAPTFAGASIDASGILLALIGLTAYHVLEYWYGFVGKGEYLRVSPAVQMFRPYTRVVVLHLTIILGAFLVFTSGQPIALVALLVGLKTAIDVGLYLFGRRRLAAS